MGGRQATPCVFRLQGLQVLCTIVFRAGPGFQQSGSVADGKGKTLLKETRLATAAADMTLVTPSLPSSASPSRLSAVHSPCSRGFHCDPLDSADKCALWGPRRTLCDLNLNSASSESAGPMKTRRRPVVILDSCTIIANILCCVAGRGRCV